MLPIKMELTEKIAATLRRLRLEHPVNGEILTAENLSKAIGNNRAWMSQIESRRLKKIKREDIVKIYKLLHNESDDAKAELLAEADLCSPFETRYDSEREKSFYANDSYSEGIVSLDNLMSDLRDILWENYKIMDRDVDRNTLLGCVEAMISNFRNDYEHTKKIYTVPISFADPEYFGEDCAKEYYSSLDKVYNDYTTSLNEAFAKADTDSFLRYCIDIYNGIIEDMTSIDSSDLFDYMDIVIEIEHYNRRIFHYIERVQDNKHHSSNISLDALFNMLITMINTLIKKLKLEYTFSNEIPTFQSTKSTLDAKQLEITNAIMLVIKHISARR